MKEHIKRKIEYSKDVFPEEGTPEYERAVHKVKQYEEDPHFSRLIKERQAEAVKTWELQDSNGIGLFMDAEIRHFLNEFNSRSWNFGHRKMPLMFNVMEAFFTLDKRLNYWKLLDEEDYSISFFDFIDFYTSNKFENNISEIKENLEEDLIYNFNVGYDLKEITFKTEDGDEFVIAGVSFVRRGDEVSMLFDTGQIIDTEKKSAELTPLEKFSTVVGKEKIEPSKDRVREAVRLDDDLNLWKTLVACRFDLEANTLDARYVAKDEGNSFRIYTDDITGFMSNEEWKDPSHEETFKNFAKQIENYNSIFELAKICLLLPNYFNFFENEIEEEEHQTSVKSILKNPLKKREFNVVDNSFKIRSRTLWTLNRNSAFLSDRIKLRDDNFKVETSGYWKKLAESEIGTNKNGNAVIGKTWVNKTESFYVSKEEQLIIERKKDSKFTTKNSGKIYIMRNGNLGNNIYKIGLTTNNTDERAKQLSNTSVPDKFYVMREWDVKDCFFAEKTIHKLLEKHRVDKRREFFQLDMKIANDVIDSVVNSINLK